MFRAIFRSVFYIALIVLSMAANVYFHELGHFAVADAFGLTPNVHFAGYDELKEVAFSAHSVPLAYVSYTVSSSSLQDFLIAGAGPLVNILMAILLAVMYAYTPLKERLSVKMAYFIVFIPTILAVVSNLIPMAGTDGYLILKALSVLF